MFAIAVLMDDCYLSPLQQAEKQTIVLKIATLAGLLLHRIRFEAPRIIVAAGWRVKQIAYGRAANFYGSVVRRKRTSALAELPIAAGRTFHTLKTKLSHQEGKIKDLVAEAKAELAKEEAGEQTPKDDTAHNNSAQRIGVQS